MVARHDRNLAMYLSVIFLDIDYFKKINDHYGHQVGDNVLIEFCNCLRAGLPDKSEWIARYGGEEFLIVLPNTPIKDAGALAEKLRKELSGVVVNGEGPALRFTASFGVSSFDGTKKQSAPTLSPETLINEADRCLYQAKDEGRDCVSLSQDSE